MTPWQTLRLTRIPTDIEGYSDSDDSVADAEFEEMNQHDSESELEPENDEELLSLRMIPKEKYHPDALKRFESIKETQPQINGPEEANNELLDKENILKRFESIKETQPQINGPEEANNELLDKENIQPRPSHMSVENCHSEQMGQNNKQDRPSHMSVENCHSEQMGQNNKQDRPSNVSFQDLLLKTVKQNATSSSSTKKRRVATDAEVITHQNLEYLPVPQNKAPSGRAIKTATQEQKSGQH
ncbi:hypothetical protein QE152_g13657 [Popillia japonica]|uniref:Uncharacterized protein n=1 Tax=Popillia japonica TaxID=7064 RepID=A0AAW1L918_POPJA